MYYKVNVSVGISNDKADVDSDVDKDAAIGNYYRSLKLL